MTVTTMFVAWRGHVYFVEVHWRFWWKFFRHYRSLAWTGWWMFEVTQWDAPPWRPWREH